MNQRENGTPSILDRLARGDVLISDGAAGTYLQDYGLAPGAPPDVFNLSQPAVVRGMAAEYFAAGSDMVLTNSFGANSFVLGKHGYGEHATEINRLAAAHAQAAAPPGGHVVGTVGPSGELLSPLGAVSETEMMAAFVEQVTALAEGGVDALVIESIMSLEEGTLAIRAAKENTCLPVMATMVFDKGKRGFFTMMGLAPKPGIEGLLEAGADVVGANCGGGSEEMVELVAELRAATDGYLIIQSSAGLPAFSNGQISYPDAPEDMADRFRVLASELGVNILGGCCGTNAEHIRAMRQAVHGGA